MTLYVNLKIKRRAAPSPPFLYLFKYVFISVGTCEYLFYSVGHNLLLSLGIFLLKLSQVWPLGAPSSE